MIFKYIYIFQPDTRIMKAEVSTHIGKGPLTWTSGSLICEIRGEGTVPFFQLYPHDMSFWKYPLPVHPRVIFSRHKGLQWEGEWGNTLWHPKDRALDTNFGFVPENSLHKLPYLRCGRTWAVRFPGKGFISADVICRHSWFVYENTHPWTDCILWYGEYYSLLLLLPSLHPFILPACLACITAI